MTAIPPVAPMRWTVVRRTPAGRGSRDALRRRSADPDRRSVIAV
jgi:hypothetical protein